MRASKEVAKAVRLWTAESNWEGKVSQLTRNTDDDNY